MAFYSFRSQFTRVLKEVHCFKCSNSPNEIKESVPKVNYLLKFPNE